MNLVCVEHSSILSNAINSLFPNARLHRVSQLENLYEYSFGEAFFVDLSLPSQETLFYLNHFAQRYPKKAFFLFYDEEAQLSNFLKQGFRFPIHLFNYKTLLEDPHVISHQFKSYSATSAEGPNTLTTTIKEKSLFFTNLVQSLNSDKKERISINMLLRVISHFFQMKEIFWFSCGNNEQKQILEHYGTSENRIRSFINQVTPDALRQSLTSTTNIILSSTRTNTSRNTPPLLPLLKTSSFQGIIYLGQKNEVKHYLCFSTPQSSSESLHLILLLKSLFLEEFAPLEPQPNLDKTPLPNSSSNQLDLLSHFSEEVASLLKNKLVSIKTFTQLLPQKHKDQQFRKDFFKVVTNEVESMEQSIYRISLLSKLFPSQKEWISPQLSLDEVELHFQEKFHSLELSFKINSNEKCFVDEKQLTQLFIEWGILAQELGGSSVNIDVWPKKNELICQVLLKDANVSSKPDIPFSSLAHEEGPLDHCLSLLIIEKIIQRHEGKVQLLKSKKNGSLFEIKFSYPSPELIGGKRATQNNGIKTSGRLS